MQTIKKIKSNFGRQAKCEKASVKFYELPQPPLLEVINCIEKFFGAIKMLAISW